MGRILKQGDGWRLGWNPDSEDFPGLIGAEGWALELTWAEWDEFQRLLVSLTEAVAAIASELMDGEKVACEMEGELLWLGAEGYAQHYDVRIVLSSGRRAEGSWAAGAIASMVQTLPTLSGF
ncbi:MAG: DUF1818 family protein [Cyanophyceae cyanobacterium]